MLSFQGSLLLQFQEGVHRPSLMAGAKARLETAIAAKT